MPDWLYDVVEAFVGFMDGLTLVDTAAFLLAGTLALPFVVLIHEIGHALAAVAARRRVAELTVGDDTPVLTVHLRRFRLRLGAVTGSGDAAGFILYEDDLASPRATFIIALAGPLASFVGALATGAAVVWVWPSVGLSALFCFATLAGVMCGVTSLGVSGDSPGTWSDGVWIRGAWRAMRRRSAAPRTVSPAWEDPREATSVAPPP